MTIRYSPRFDPIRPLQLVDAQPAEALERSRRMALTFKPVNLTASPLPGVGGLSIVALTLLLTLLVPGAWVVLLGSMLAGIGIGTIMIAMARRAGQAGDRHSMTAR